MTRKTRTIQIRVTDEEHASYAEMAKLSGLSVSEWLRALASSNPVKTHKTFFKKGMKT